MGCYLDLVRQATAKEGRDNPVRIGGRIVRRIIRQTEKAIVFQDEAGAFWRYLHAYEQCWPAVVLSSDQSAVIQERKESVAGDASSSNKVGDYVNADFIVTGNN